MIERVGESGLSDPEPWAIKGTVGGLTVLWAPYASYKTFVAISMGVAVAAGRAWFGKQVRQGTVLYVVGEGGVELFKRRVAAAAKEAGLTAEEFRALPLWMTTTSADLSTPVKLEPHYSEWDMVGPSLIFVDTVSRALVGDENKQEIMQGFVAALDVLRSRYGASVVAVHHANRGGQIRGSNVLPSAADVVIRLSRGSGSDGARRVLNFRADKLRDLDTEEFEPRVLYPHVVDVRHEDGELMVDEFGDKVTTLVLREEVEVLEREATALAILEHLAGSRPSDKAVGYKEWQEASGQTATTFKRAVGGLVAGGKVVRPLVGQYFPASAVTEVISEIVPGENWDTSEDERVRRELDRIAAERVELGLS